MRQDFKNFSQVCDSDPNFFIKSLNGLQKNFVHSFLLGTRYSLSNDFEEFSQIPDIDP